MMSSHESTVLDLWDRGQSKQSIVKQTGFTRQTVDKIVSMFTGGQTEQLEDERAIECGTRQLAAAIRFYHPDAFRQVQS